MRVGAFGVYRGTLEFRTESVTSDGYGGPGGCSRGVDGLAFGVWRLAFGVGG